MAIFTASFLFKDYGIGISGESWDEVVEEAKRLGLDADKALQHVAKPSLRYPPQVDPNSQAMVQSPGKEGCQECGGSFGHLTREDAIELYGLPVCSACGKLI